MPLRALYAIAIVNYMRRIKYDGISTYKLGLKDNKVYYIKAV